MLKATPTAVAAKGLRQGECFVAAWESGVQMIFEGIYESQREASNQIEHLRLGLRAYLRTLASKPAFARAFLVEVVAAGPRAESRPRRGARALRDPARARRGRPDLPKVPRERATGVGAFRHTTDDLLAAGAAVGELPDFADVMADFAASSPAT